MQRKKNKKCFIVNCMILTFLTILTILMEKISSIVIVKNYPKNLQRNNSTTNEKEIIQQRTKRQNIGDIDDDDEVYNNPNLHSEEMD
ncbi:unnamed protein product [Rhizophagus irregularis]|nr:unnamed protein product [Rhizophagus irregularis]CAB5298670.1 unnamed protein product [Rhizophagus irregularis]